MSDSGRYDGKPFLRLLEFYVLKAIGELSPSDEDNLIAFAPKLQALYGGGAQWHEAIAKAMHMPSEMPAMIRDMWRKNLDIARANGAVLTPQAFAEMFVDENFAP